MLMYLTLKTKMMMNWRRLLICCKLYAATFFAMSIQFEVFYSNAYLRHLLGNGSHISHHFLLLLDRFAYLSVSVAGFVSASMQKIVCESDKERKIEGGKDLGGGIRDGKILF